MFVSFRKKNSILDVMVQLFRINLNNELERNCSSSSYSAPRECDRVKRRKLKYMSVDILLSCISTPEEYICETHDSKSDRNSDLLRSDLIINSITNIEINI